MWYIHSKLPKDELPFWCEARPKAKGGYQERCIGEGKSAGEALFALLMKLKDAK